MWALSLSVQPKHTTRTSKRARKVLWFVQFFESVYEFNEAEISINSWISSISSESEILNGEKKKKTEAFKLSEYFHYIFLLACCCWLLLRRFSVHSFSSQISCFVLLCFIIITSSAQEWKEFSLPWRLEFEWRNDILQAQGCWVGARCLYFKHSILN